MDGHWIVLVLALTIGICSAKPAQSFDTVKSSDYVQAVEKFYNLLYKISSSLSANSSDNFDGENQVAEDENIHPANNLLVHILDSIRKGHATAENFAHWQAQLQEQFAKGLITEEVFHNFLVEFNNITHSDATDINEHCCLFG